MIGHEGKHRHRPVGDDGFDEGRFVGGTDPFASPQDLGFGFDVVAVDPEHQPLAAVARIEGGHHARGFRRAAAAVRGFQDEAPGMIRHAGPAHLFEAQSPDPT